MIDKIAFYSVITGKYDTPKYQPVDDRYSYYLASDIYEGGTHWIPTEFNHRLKLMANQMGPRMASRHVKTNPLFWFPRINAQYLVYMDASIELKVHPDIIYEEISKWDFSFFKHGLRGTALQELDEVEKLGLVSAQEKYDTYRWMVMSHAWGLPLYGGGFFAVKAINSHLLGYWWSLISGTCQRDQVTLPYFVRKMIHRGYYVQELAGTILSNDWFDVAPHGG